MLPLQPVTAANAVTKAPILSAREQLRSDRIPAISPCTVHPCQMRLCNLCRMAVTCRRRPRLRADFSPPAVAANPILLRFGIILATHPWTRLWKGATCAPRRLALGSAIVCIRFRGTRRTLPTNRCGGRFNHLRKITTLDSTATAGRPEPGPDDHSQPGRHPRQILSPTCSALHSAHVRPPMVTAGWEYTEMAEASQDQEQRGAGGASVQCSVFSVQCSVFSVQCSVG
jgi:hypothetical protein